MTRIASSERWSAWRPAAAGLIAALALPTGAAAAEEAPAPKPPERPAAEAAPAPETAPATSAAVEVGAEAPDFELAAPDGSRRRLSSLRGKKPVVLVFFRGTW